MAQPRRSRRIAQIQSRIVSNDGFVGYGRGNRSNRNERRRRSNANNGNSLPLTHGPPWTQQELKRKRNVALKAMLSHYGIVEGHRWCHQDRVSALYNYGRRVIQSTQEEMLDDDHVDQSMYRLLHFLVSKV